MLQSNFKRRPGFTVIELLAVVTIAAILVGVLFLREQTPQPTADGDVVIGYDFKSPDRMKTVRVAKPLPGGQNTFELFVENQTFKIEAGKPFWFTNQFPEGVDAFIIRGINPSEQLDPNNNLAFPTGISWM